MLGKNEFFQRTRAELAVFVGDANIGAAIGEIGRFLPVKGDAQASLVVAFDGFNVCG